MSQQSGPVGDLPPLLTPEPHETGLLSSEPAVVRERTVRAWEVFVDVVEGVDLSAATRSRGNRARHLLASLGAWPDSRGLADMVADARAGVTVSEPQSEADARLRATHGDEPDAQIVAAVRRAADHIREWFDRPEALELSRLVTASPLGPVPIGTYLYASSFHLAVTARDLVPAGAPPVPELDGLGVVALVDSTGAVAARVGATASIAAVTPEATVGTGAHEGAWCTVVATADTDHLGPAVLGPAGLVIDVAAGRADFLQVARSLRLKHPRRLVAMSAVLDGIPDLPAATMLRRAAAVARSLPW